MVASFADAAHVFQEWLADPMHAGWGFLMVADKATLAAYPWLDREAGRLDARKVAPSREISIVADTIAKDVDCNITAPSDVSQVALSWIGAATFNV